MNFTFFHEVDHTSDVNDEDINKSSQAQTTTIARDHHPNTGLLLREADAAEPSTKKLVPTNVRMSSQYKVCSYHSSPLQ